MLNTQTMRFPEEDDEELLREALVEEGIEEEYKDDPVLSEEDFQGLIDWYMELGEILLEIAMKERRWLTLDEFKTRLSEYSIYYDEQDDSNDYWLTEISRVCEAHRLLWGNFEGMTYGPYRYVGA